MTGAANDFVRERIDGLPPEHKPFWEACARQELTAQRCDDCGRFRYPPAAQCPNCLSENSTWQRLSGRGQVYSWSVIHHEFTPAYPPPYNVAIIELDEGIRMPSNIIGCDNADIRAGMPVEVSFDEVSDGTFLPRFRPA